MSEKRFRKSISKKSWMVEYKPVEVNRSAGNASSKKRAGKFPIEVDWRFEDTVVNLSSNHGVETPVLIFMTGHKADPKWDSFIRGVRGLIFQNPQITVDRIAAIHNHPPQAQFLWRLEFSLVAVELWRELTFRICLACCRDLAGRMRRCVRERTAGETPAAR